MSRVVVIGGSGHVGTYLVPRLVEAGFEVVNVCRGKREPYTPHAAWKRIRAVTLDREAAERDGAFGRSIRELKPDIVIDMICFTRDSAEHIVDALDGHVGHFLHCGTIWVHGHSVAVPTTEAAPRHPFGEYGTQKAAIEALLLKKARERRFPATIVHPGHIVGPGWSPLNPAGHFNNRIFTLLANGEELALPNFGLETVHHVHADDVAQVFMRAIANWSGSVGESFHAVSPAAVTLRGYAEAMSRWFGKEPRLTFLPWERWTKTASEEEAAQTLEHISRSPSCSIAKAKRLLGYRPRYTSFEAVAEAVTWLVKDGQVDVG
jgi:nucleoside-diphosphate-sugar epimerase